MPCPLEILFKPYVLALELKAGIKSQQPQNMKLNAVIIITTAVAAMAFASSKDDPTPITGKEEIYKTLAARKPQEDGQCTAPEPACPPNSPAGE